MLDSILSDSVSTLGLTDVLICTGVSLILGAVIAWVYWKSEGKSKNFALTLVLLPALVQMVIMMVQGNLGAGVAVAGTFSLVRFRSVPGNSKDIATIFFAMAIGLATGMGCVNFAILFTLIVAILYFVLTHTIFRTRDNRKTLRITVPEDLEYTHQFDDLFETYTKKIHLKSVKTTNLGSLFQLEYVLELKNPDQEKELIDALRCRNGNCPILCSDEASGLETL